MLKKFLLGLGLSLAAVAQVPAAAAPPAAVADEARKDFVGTLKALPGGKLVLETPTKTYELDFASRTASREARQLAGLQVKARAVERKDRLMVHSSSTVVHFCFKH